MKKNIRLIIATLFCLSVTSCNSDILSLFSKVEYFSFIRNSTDKDVQISFSYGDKDVRWNIAAGEELEIYDIERWDLVTSPEVTGFVTFLYEDGRCISHAAQMIQTGEDMYELQFTPAEHNILDNASWTLSKMGGNKMRYDYEIK